mmetsp:Transcript_68710/g.136099  ORF Transcript_68710/g.136099 Transcript_68710/m.136099 type:complete len:245 (-) Transcript_68710:79-813(-)
MVAPRLPISKPCCSSSTRLRITATGPIAWIIAFAASTPPAVPASTTDFLLPRSILETTPTSVNLAFQMGVDSSSCKSSSTGTRISKRSSSGTFSRCEDCSRHCVERCWSSSSYMSRSCSLVAVILLRSSSISASHSFAFLASSFIFFISAIAAFSSFTDSDDRCISCSFRWMSCSTSPALRVLPVGRLFIMRSRRCSSRAIDSLTRSMLAWVCSIVASGAAPCVPSWLSRAADPFARPVILSSS